MARKIAKDHEEKRRQILLAAAQVFAREGYGRASMHNIAAACGISKANIYHYHDSKEALLFDLLERHLRELRDRVQAVADAEPDREARFRAAIREILSLYQGADDCHRVQMSSLGFLPADKQECLRQYQRDLVACMSAFIAGLAPAELAADRKKLRSVTMSVFAMLNWYFMWNSGAGTAAREAYANLAADLTLNGIRAV